MLLVAGTYERFLLGFDVPAVGEAASEEAQPLARKFTYAAHQMAVRCAKFAGQYLVSGGNDDQIHLYDIKNGKDMGFLMNPNDGAVPCLAVYTPPRGRSSPSHLFSGSADGGINVWQVGGNWEHLKSMGGHKGSVNSIAVHPSGRIALSVARDKALRMWNMIKGRCSYTAILENEGDVIDFTPSGDAYALVCGPTVSVHSTAGEGGLLATLDNGRRVLCMLQPGEDTLACGLEDGSLHVWDVRTSAPQMALDRLHPTRIRGLVSLDAGDGSSMAGGGSVLPTLLGTASSDGLVRVWDTRMLSGSGACSCLAEAATRARVTCLTAGNPNAPVRKQAKQLSKQRGAAAEGAASQAKEHAAADMKAAAAARERAVTAAEPCLASAKAVQSKPAKRERVREAAETVPAPSPAAVATSAAGPIPKRTKHTSGEAGSGGRPRAAGASTSAAAAVPGHEPSAWDDEDGDEAGTTTNVTLMANAGDSAADRVVTFDENDDAQRGASGAKNKRFAGNRKKAKGAAQLADHGKQGEADEALLPRMQTKLKSKSGKAKEAQRVVASKKHGLRR